MAFILPLCHIHPAANRFANKMVLRQPLRDFISTLLESFVAWVEILLSCGPCSLEAASSQALERCEVSPGKNP